MCWLLCGLRHSQIDLCESLIQSNYTWIKWFSISTDRFYFYFLSSWTLDFKRCVGAATAAVTAAISANKTAGALNGKSFKVDQRKNTFYCLNLQQQFFFFVGLFEGEFFFLAIFQELRFIKWSNWRDPTGP